MNNVRNETDEARKKKNGTEKTRENGELRLSVQIAFVEVEMHEEFFFLLK